MEGPAAVVSGGSLPHCVSGEGVWFVRGGVACTVLFVALVPHLVGVVISNSQNKGMGRQLCK